MSEFQTKFDPLVHEVVKNIPEGQVMTYAAVARKAGYPRHARMVGKALFRCNKELPWHRVIKSDSTLAFPPSSYNYQKQKLLLETEGNKLIDGKVIPAKVSVEKNLDELIWGPE